MKRISFRIGLYLTINLLIIIFGFFHLEAVFKRPRAPFHLTRQDNRLIIDKIINPGYCGDLRSGDQVISWNEYQLNIPEITEFLAEKSKVGKQVTIIFNRDGVPGQTIITLLPYHPTYRYVFIIFFVGFITWCVSIFILLKGPPHFTTTTLHWTIGSLGLATIFTTGAMSPLHLQSYIARGLFLLFYMLAVSGVLFFSSTFPRSRERLVFLKAALIFIPSGILAALMEYYFLSALYFQSIILYARFQNFFDFFHALLFFYLGLSIFNFIYSYRSTPLSEDQKRLKLILTGIAIGSAPFLLLSILPQIFERNEIIREEFTLIFFLVIPFTFTLAILKYRLLDIDLLINRSLVYGLLTLMIGALYIVTVLTVISVIGGEIVFDDYLFLLLTTLIVAIIFNPLRHALQKIIDNLFFSARENYRKAVNEITRDLDKVLSSEDLFQQLIISLTRLVPIQHLALYRIVGDSLILQHSSRLDTQTLVSFPGIDLHQMIAAGQIYALPKSVYLHPTQMDFSRSDFLQRINFSVCIPLLTKTTYFTGLLCIIPYHDRFIEAEIDLLRTGCTRAAEILDRLLLQERMIIEREEKKRMKEISSYIISLVAHELQSPLTSIRMFAELLQQKDKIPEKEFPDYLHIIETESIRLSRLIKNVLDYSRIDRGIKEYHFEVLNLNRLIEHVLNVFRQQLEKNNFQVDVHLTEEDTTLMADEDALISVITNLLANAIKYSPEEKYIFISTAVENQHIQLCVRDKGIGIPGEEQSRVFDDFYRSGHKQVQSLSGLGLGLSLVKRIILAHKGTIQVDSKPGKETLFTIILPSGVSYEKNSDH